MSTSLKYAMTGAAALTVIVGGLWPLLDAAGRTGVLLAAAIALPVQVIAFAALVRFRSELEGFLVAWLGGTLVRMVILGVAALVVIRSGMDGAVPMLLALAGFFFGLLLLEPIYLRSGTDDVTTAGPVQATAGTVEA